MSAVVLSVPQVVTSHYVIATSEPPADPYAAVPWRVPPPFRRSAIEALKTPRLGIFTIDAREAPWRLDDVLACDDDRRRIQQASHHIVVAHAAAAGEQPHREQTARAVARALADASGGVLVDPQARQVLLRDGLARDERVRFRMGDQWFGVRYADGGAAHGDPGAASRCCPAITASPAAAFAVTGVAGACGVGGTTGTTGVVADAAGTAGTAGARGVAGGGGRCGCAGDHAPAGCTCLRITLLGLRRFGLPDLVIDGVPRGHDLPALNLLRAVARRLLTDQWRWSRERPGRPTRLLDDHPTIEPDDFWAFWAATPCADGRPVTVRLVAASAGVLEVRPPDGHRGTRAEWCRRVLARAMPPLVGCPADEDTVSPGSVRAGA